MRIWLLTLPLFFLFSEASAVAVQGTITGERGNALPFASVYVKGSGVGASANAEGQYILDLPAGHYTLICQYLGYVKTEKEITVSRDPLVVDFQLTPLHYRLNEVVIKPGGEDPAYAIIRQAIKKRPFYLNQVRAFTCNVYIKSLLKLRNAPKKFLGQSVQWDGMDSARRGIVFLSESLSRLSVEKPNQRKVEVFSARESGNSKGYGFNEPTPVNFYENNVVLVSPQANPRGFVSPVARHALDFYTYRLEGTFTEDGKEIAHIKVTPKRKYEPLLSGYINITEGSWRIHSLQLTVTKTSQLQLLDTLRIEQMLGPVNDSTWMLKNQVIYPVIRLFGFNADGNFVYVFSDYQINPAFPPGYFNRIVLKVDSAANKKSLAYWDSIRPVPLEREEARDYIRKDSIERLHQSPAYLDSVDRAHNKITLGNITWSGVTLHKQRRKENWFISPLFGVRRLEYNTVEGLTPKLSAGFNKSLADDKALYFQASGRYGISNRHFNMQGTAGYNFGKSNKNYLRLTGGRWVFQFNNVDPISPLMNSLYTLFDHRNYMKLYEAWHADLLFSRSLYNGIGYGVRLQYQDRLPLENTTDYSFIKADRSFTPNYPEELISQQFTPHRTFSAEGFVSYQPGRRYIEYPGYRYSIGSPYPVFRLDYVKGLNGIFGSVVNYDKWKFSVSQRIGLKLFGAVDYRVSAGGFLNAHNVPVQDYQHFNGNQTLAAIPYLSGFQLAPYYSNSTTAGLYATFNGEYHFNGLLTNKIPLFRKLNWFLVTGSNAFYVNPKNNYVELFAGLENIFKIVRVDAVTGYRGTGQPAFGIRVGVGVNVGQ